MFVPDDELHEVFEDYGGSRYTCRTCRDSLDVTCLKYEYMLPEEWREKLNAWTKRHPFLVAKRWPGE
jgi:hypothetical protein